MNGMTHGCDPNHRDVAKNALSEIAVVTAVIHLIAAPGTNKFYS